MLLNINFISSYTTGFIDKNPSREEISKTDKHASTKFAWVEL